jgi:NAD(P)-dependent dehydrogenase (short-subunit alcohol dehydrogenase family)
MDALAETAAGAAGAAGQIQPRQVDVTVESAVRGLVSSAEELGGVDFIVNNAGVSLLSPLLEITTDEWAQTELTNVRGVLWGCKYAVASMVDRGVAGAVVNIGSTASLAGVGYAIGYTMSKHAVLGLTRAIAADPAFASAGIRANCVCPGDIDTPMAEEWFQATEDPVAARAELEAFNPTGRLGTPEEVAEVVVFLCSDRSSLINGATLTADLGQRARLM